MATTSVSITPQLTAFTKFIDLPIELRYMIWRATLEPRVVGLGIDNTIDVHLPFVPKAFAVHKESRTLIKALYRPLFKIDARVRGTYPCVDNFNFSIDTLLIHNDNQLSAFTGVDVRILSAAMTDHAKASLKYFGVDEDYVRAVRLKFPVVGALEIAVERWKPLFPQLKSFLVDFNFTNEHAYRCMHREFHAIIGLGDSAHEATTGLQLETLRNLPAEHYILSQVVERLETAEKELAHSARGKLFKRNQESLERQQTPLSPCSKSKIFKDLG